MSSVCMGRWCSVRVQCLCVTLSRKILPPRVMSMFTSSKAVPTTPVLDTMQYPLQFFTLFSSQHCPMTNEFLLPTSFSNQVVL